MTRLSEDELREIAQSAESEYRPEARQAAEVELARRGLSLEPHTEDSPATQDSPVTRSRVQALIDDLHTERSVSREALATGSLTLALWCLYESLADLAFRLAVFRHPLEYGDLIPALSWGSWMMQLAVGLLALFAGIQLGERWRLLLGLLLISFGGLYLPHEVRHLASSSEVFVQLPAGYSLVRLLLAIAWLPAGIWLLQADRTQQAQHLRAIAATYD